MKLKKITIKNFLSIQEATIDLDNRGIVLIDGINNTPATAIDTNGTGKSSMLSAIYYAIYGESPNGEKADALINRNAGKGLLVTLDFEVEGTPYTISRGRKKNILTLVSGDTDLTKGTMKETQVAIDDLVNIRKDVYLSTIYFDGHNSVPFSMLTDKQRKDYLEILFDVGVYKEAYEQTKTDLAEVKNNLTLVKSTIQNLNRTKESEADSIAQLKHMQESSGNGLPKLKAELESKQQSLEVFNEKATAALSKLEEEKKTISARLEPYKDDRYVEIERGLRETKRKLDRTNDELVLKKSRIKDLADKIRNMSESELCLVCGNPIDEEHKKKEVNRLTQELKPLVADYKELGATVPNLQEKVAAFTEEFKEEQEVQEQYSKAQRTVYNDLGVVDGKIKEIETAKFRKQTDYDTTRMNYESAVRSASEFDGMIKNHEQKLSAIQEELQDLDTNLNSLIQDELSLEKALTAFSDKGIKSHVLDFVTPELNTRIGNYLNFLTGGTITVVFSTQTQKANGEMSDKFDIQVNNNGKQTTYESLSSGEKRRVDIAISLTLQDILISKSNMSTNVLVYDELFESLDAVGAESVVELLRQRLESSSTILVVTHNENLKPLFAETITAVKEKDGNTHILNGEKV